MTRFLLTVIMACALGSTAMAQDTPPAAEYDQDHNPTFDDTTPVARKGGTPAAAGEVPISIKPVDQFQELEHRGLWLSEMSRTQGYFYMFSAYYKLPNEWTIIFSQLRAHSTCPGKSNESNDEFYKCYYKVFLKSPESQYTEAKSMPSFLIDARNMSLMVKPDPDKKFYDFSVAGIQYRYSEKDKNYIQVTQKQPIIYPNGYMEIKLNDARPNDKYFDIWKAELEDSNPGSPLAPEVSYYAFGDDTLTTLLSSEACGAHDCPLRIVDASGKKLLDITAPWGDTGYAIGPERNGHRTLFIAGNPDAIWYFDNTKGRYVLDANDKR